MSARLPGRLLRYIAAGAVGLVVAGAAGAAFFVASGRYDIAAMHPHSRMVRSVLKFVQRRSITYHARNHTAPELDDPTLVRRGLTLYREHCVVCHGAPGEARERAGIGLNPTPPPLEQAIERWSAGEIYWTTAYGLKMAGMPSFLLGRTPGEIWAIVAFIRQMNRLTPDEYRRLVIAAADTGATADVPWLGPTRSAAIAELRGDPVRGKRLLGEFGCIGCHVIPGIRTATGAVGPPLTRWAERQFISGRLVNTPAALAAWIVNPRAVEPNTAMPVLGVTAEQAEHMAAYLYTVGRRPR
jgi:mono/diheme cytochrome c family protein